MINHERIIVALDGMSATKALRLAGKLSGHVWGFKVNDLLFDDPRIIKKLKKFGGVFADAKLHDIPNTVGNSVRRLSGLGADIITVHTSGGIEMMKAACLGARSRRHAKRSASRTKIIAVTVLTSQKLSARKKFLILRVTQLPPALMGLSVQDTSCRRSKNKGNRGEAYHCSRRASALVRKKDDQRRTMTPDKALSLGADHIVIGRPITEAKDPLIAVRSLSS